MGRRRKVLTTSGKKSSGAGPGKRGVVEKMKVRIICHGNQPAHHLKQTHFPAEDGDKKKISLVSMTRSIFRRQALHSKGKA